MTVIGCGDARRKVAHGEHEYFLGGLRTQCPGFRDGDEVTAGGKVYRNLPDVTVSPEERRFDANLLSDFMRTIPDHIDHSSAIWGAAQLVLMRRKAVRAQGCSERADDAALRGPGQDPPSVPI